MTQLRIDARRREEAIELIRGYRYAVDFGESDLVEDATDLLVEFVAAVFKITPAETRVKH
jgi:hypothetical protein